MVASNPRKNPDASVRRKYVLTWPGRLRLPPLNFVRLPLNYPIYPGIIERQHVSVKSHGLRVTTCPSMTGAGTTSPPPALTSPSIT
jgi:hypothetical protein